MPDYKSILKQYWGYESFRGIQENIINSIGSGQDTLGLMPTGGGKSITFQVPALAMPGLCLVITPLIALMKDQVHNLRMRGIKATAVYSGMTRDEIIAALENCIYGDNTFTLSNEAKAGTSMADRTYSVIVNNFRNDVKISGGSYLGTEQVSTTAGKFDCLKVTYLKRTKLLLKNATWRVTEWYAVGVGLVKSESYDTKGNPTAKTLLVKVNR